MPHQNDVAVVVAKFLQSGQESLLNFPSNRSGFRGELAVGKHAVEVQRRPLGTAGTNTLLTIDAPPLSATMPTVHVDQPVLRELPQPEMKRHRPAFDEIVQPLTGFQQNVLHDVTGVDAGRDCPVQPHLDNLPHGISVPLHQFVDSSRFSLAGIPQQLSSLFRIRPHPINPFQKPDLQPPQRIAGGRSFRLRLSAGEDPPPEKPAGREAVTCIERLSGRKGCSCRPRPKSSSYGHFCPATGAVAVKLNQLANQPELRQMDVSFINHFIESATNVFDTMLGVQVTRKSLSLKDSPAPTHEVSAIIGLSGRVSGSVVVSFSTNVALKGAGEMLLTEYDDVNAEVVDAVGELTNMIAGGAKAAMDNMELSLGLPNVVCGRDHKIFFPGSVKPVSVGFDTPWGEMAIDVGFNEVLEGSLESVAAQETIGV